MKTEYIKTLIDEVFDSVYPEGCDNRELVDFIERLKEEIGEGLVEVN